MRCDASIVARHKTDEDGYTLTLVMGDGKGELNHLSVVCPGEEQARKIESNYRRDEEFYYLKVAALLSK